MKIYEIISKENESINEAPAALTSKVLGGIASGAAKVLGKEKEEAIKYIMSLVDKNTGKISSNLSAAEKAFIEKNPKLVAKAEKTVQSEIKQAKYASDKAFLSSKVGNISSIISSVYTLAKSGGYVFIIGKPLYDFNQEIERGLEQVKSGAWSEEKFQQYKNQRISILVGKITKEILAALGVTVASFLTRKVGYYAGNMLTFGMLKKIPGFSKLSGIANITTTGAMMYFMNSVNTEEGANAIANFMIQPILGSEYTYSDVISSAVNLLTNAVSDAVEHGDTTNSHPSSNKPDVNQTGNNANTVNAPTSTGVSDKPSSSEPSSGYVSSLEPAKWSDYNKGN